MFHSLLSRQCWNLASALQASLKSWWMCVLMHPHSARCCKRSKQGDLLVLCSSSSKAQCWCHANADCVVKSKQSSNAGALIYHGCVKRVRDKAELLGSCPGNSCNLRCYSEVIAVRCIIVQQRKETVNSHFPVFSCSGLWKAVWPKPRGTVQWEMAAAWQCQLRNKKVEEKPEVEELISFISDLWCCPAKCFGHSAWKGVLARGGREGCFPPSTLSYLLTLTECNLPARESLCHVAACKDTVLLQGTEWI